MSDIKRIHETISLLSSMIRGGEKHSDISEQAVVDALAIAEKIKNKYESEPRWQSLEEFDDYSERKGGSTMEECFIFQRDELRKEIGELNKEIKELKDKLMPDPNDRPESCPCPTCRKIRNSEP